MEDELKCVFCGSKEEVSLAPVDYPRNLKPVCLACWERFQDACRDNLEERR